MTKKNVAALMLAGAMMTVGSGAMAEDSITNGGTIGVGGKAVVPVTVTANDTVSITIKWTALGDDGFVFSWVPANGKWESTTESKNVTFEAKNSGAIAKTVAVEPGANDNLTWFEVTKGEGTTGSAAVQPTAYADTTYTEVAKYVISAKAGATKPTAGTADIAFTVAISD